MITPEEFPYIKSLYINDCYAYKDFNVELHDYKPFSHLILTGKNGSGKSTILKTIDRYFSIWRGIRHQNYIVTINNPIKHLARLKSSIVDQKKTKGVHSSEVINTQTEIDFLDRIALSYKREVEDLWIQNKATALYAFFQAKRVSEVSQVNTVTREVDFVNQLLGDDTSETFVKKFKQYLVNKKVYQAFDQIDNNKNQLFESEYFFNKLTIAFRSIFEDVNLSLVFVRESFEFFLQLSDGRQLTFDVLSEGYSALLNIFMDLFMRVDLIRKQVGDYSYDPCGIVLIDEPETHLHLQLQEQVLPLLTSLFPNVQFIVATHSPAVIASIKNATIFDLTTKESRGSEETVGRSYSELMRAHFGLNNEYSGIADELFGKVDQLIKGHRNQPEQLKMKLQQFFVENEPYLSPTFRVELESMILENV